MTNAIRKLREQSKLTQLELACEMRTDRTTVTKWETGKSFPSAKHLPKLATLLNCKIEDLYGSDQ